MPNIKVPEVPAPTTEQIEIKAEAKSTEVPDVKDEKLARRAEIEAAVEAANAEVPLRDIDVEADVKPEAKTETEPKEEEAVDPVERIKRATQKRIDKLTAKTKSAEEELAELRIENERLRANPKQPEKEDPKDNTPPTLEQVRAYIALKREEGNHKEADAAVEYLIDLKKEQAIKEVRDEQTKAQTQTTAETARQNAAMKDLANDYVAYDTEGKPDIKSDMTLANQKGLLFKLAMDYFNDKDRHAERYNDPNVVNGFRRATADAYRDIMEHGRTNKTPKVELPDLRRNSRETLAEPGSDFSDEAPTQSTASNNLSDAEKVREEIKLRNKNRYLRKIPN